MKRVDTSEATTSRGAEEVGPAGLPTPLEPGVTWSVVLGVSEGGGKEGRATTLGWEGVGREGWWDESKGDREGDSRSMSGSGGRNIVQRCPKGAGWGEELKWKWQWNERKGGNKKKKKQNNNNVTKKKKKTLGVTRNHNTTLLLHSQSWQRGRDYTCRSTHTCLMQGQWEQNIVSHT